MALRGKRTMLLTAAPCAAVLGFVAFALKDCAEEAWYIHKVETGSAAEVEKYGARLRSIASAQTIPQLRRLLGRKKALILRKDSPLSRTFFETMTAIGREGVAAVILSLDEGERPVARQLFPPGEVLGGKAFLACLQHPEVEVRLESLRALVSHQKGYGLPGRAFPALITLLDDPSKVVRREAAWALAHPAAENPAVR